MMATRILIVSRSIVFWDFLHFSADSFEQCTGNVGDDDLNFIVQKAEKLQLPLISTIDPHDHIVFNQKQIRRLSQELQVLKNKTSGLEGAIKVIVMAIKIAAARDNLYIKFKSD